MNSDIANLFTQAHILAEHASRLQPSPVDILESLSHSYLSRVDPHLFDSSNFEDDLNSDIKNPNGAVAAKPDPNTNQPMEVDTPSITEHLTQEQQAQALQTAQWKTRDAIERRVHEVVLESYQAPVRDLKKMVARSRRGVRAEKEVGLGGGEASGSGKEGGTGSVYDRAIGKCYRSNCVINVYVTWNKWIADLIPSPTCTTLKSKSKLESISPPPAISPRNHPRTPRPLHNLPLRRRGRFRTIT